MALFKKSSEIVSADTDKTKVITSKDKHPVPEIVRLTFLRKGPKITYHHISQTDATKNECECKELLSADYQDLYGCWYGCIFCGFVIEAEKLTIDISLLKS